MNDYHPTILRQLLEYVTTRSLNRHCKKKPRGDSHTQEPLSTTQVASFAHLSIYQCQQLFTQALGVDIDLLLQVDTRTVAAQKLKSDSWHLQSTGDTTQKAISPQQRFHITKTTQKRQNYPTPGSKVPLWWDHCCTPLGVALIAATPKGLRTLWLADNGHQQAAKDLKDRYPRFAVIHDRNKVRPYHQYVLQSLAGDVPKLQLPIDLEGTDFQLRTWSALLQIPDASVSSYSQLARLVGAPRATQAIGTAIGANPIAYLIPCHRVIKANGEIGQYRWGVEKKCLLLNLEFAKEIGKRDREHPSYNAFTTVNPSTLLTSEPGSTEFDFTLRQRGPGYPPDSPNSENGT